MKITAVFAFGLNLLVAAFISWSCAADRPSININALDSCLNVHPDFYGVALVGKGGKALYARALGFREPLQQWVSDTAAVFELASVSKIFTSTIILQLIQENRLSLDDSLRYYFPDLPYAGISIRNLLNHTSGLPDYQAVMDSRWDKTKVAGNEECMEYLARYQPPVLFSPGQQYVYSNTGYLLLASVAEKVTGTPFRDLLRQRIFTPAGMPKADIRSATRKLQMPEMAWGFVRDSASRHYISADSLVSSNYTVWLGNRRGPGRVSATVSDLLRFDREFFSGTIVKDALRVMAFRQSVLSDGSAADYGLGWEIRKAGEVVGHSGNNPGYRTLFLHHIGRNECIILLSNNAYENLEQIAEGFQHQLGW